jgi:transcriptional regulator with GAF, ATPase, and Fis domain
MQQDRIENDANISLVQMISTQSIEEQCAKITKWLKQHYNLDVIGFFLKEHHATRAHFFTENAPMKIVHGLEDMLLKLHQAEEAQNTILLFTQNEGKLTAFDALKYSGSRNPIGIGIPLHVPDHFIGTMALIADPKTIQYFTTEALENISFVSLISVLLNNAYSHELNARKIRMLNLYQTVSSSLTYIGDLQELLSTITGIVTSELFCEESSVLFYDEDTNEFEFFTAFGETGMELVSKRFPADRGIAGRALREGKTQVVNDCKSDPDFYCNIDEEHSFQTKNIIAAPLISGNEKVGVINAINKIETNFFDKEDDQVLSAIADEVALAIKNARLFDYIVSSYCKIRQGLNTCRDCKRPLKSWTPCVRQMEMSGL